MTYPDRRSPRGPRSAFWLIFIIAMIIIVLALTQTMVER